MNKINLSIVLGLLLLGATSCEQRKEDFFVSPNTPTTATAPTLLTALEVSTMNSAQGELARTSSILIQHNAGVDNPTALEPQNYSLQEGSFENQWGQLYQALLTGKELNTRFGAANPHYKGISQVLMAMNWGMLTDLWGDVPYTEALNPEFTTAPRYDAQELVLNSTIALLDSAIGNLATPESANTVLPGPDDLLLNGDVASWTKVANTLKARMLLRFSRKPSFNPAAILTALSNGIQSSAEDLLTRNGGGGNEQNQWFAFQTQRPGYIQASTVLVDSMSLRPTDIRLFYYFDSSGFDNVVAGAPLNTSDADPSYSPFGTYLAGDPATSTPLVTFVEAKFMEAEVLARQNNNTGAATALNAAIRASATQVTSGAYTGADIATYTTAPLDRVMFEKWIAMYGQIEAYNDYRRTGFPVLTPNPKASRSTIPARYPTPRSERVGNPNAPTPSITVPVWWATP